MEQGSALIFQLAQGLALAACTGLRAFLPLFVVGVAARLDWLQLAESFRWLASTPALVVFGVAVLLEVTADKVPLVDHALDSVQFAVKPLAATLVSASLLLELSPLQATVLALVTGGALADVVHLAKSKLRLVSTTVSAGAANPLVSTVEDTGSLVGALLAIFLPLLVLALAALALLVVWRSRRRRT